jgi:hypothetical protein
VRDYSKYLKKIWTWLQKIDTMNMVVWWL